MSHRVFENSRLPVTLHGFETAFLRLFDGSWQREFIEAAMVSRTLAGNAGYSWETAAMNGQIGNGRDALTVVCRSDDRGL